MEFYKIWQTKSGIIGVNRMSLGELIGANIMVYVIYFFLLLLFVQVLPILLLAFHVVLLLNNRLDAESTANDTRERLVINVLTVISVIYFLLDFHFGWWSFTVFSVAVSKETFDAFATVNLSIGIVSIFLFFLGHEFFKTAKTPLIRLGMFAMIVFFGIRFSQPLSRGIITNVITQYNDAELAKVREEMNVVDEYNSDENIEQRKQERKTEEEAREKKMRDFDKNYTSDYLGK
jgi:hypothetical protein